MNIESLIAAYGLPAVGIGAVIEGETVVMVGGAMARRGLLDRDWLILAAASGSFLGDQTWFFLGRRWRDLPRLRALAASRGFAKARRVFDRQPGLFVFGFRFAYGLRTVSPIAIGMTDYPAGRFMAINALASLIWAWLFVSLGGILGQAFTALLGPLEAHEHLLAVLAAAAAGAAVLHLLVRRLAKR